jgi:uncharacterized membrane protein
VNLTLDQPQWLWLIALAIPLGFIALRWLVAMSVARRWSAVVFRALLLAVMALALAGTSSVRTVNTMAVVAVVDVSGSARRYLPHSDPLRRGPVEFARDFLAGVPRGPDDLLGLVVFDGRALAVATPTRAEVLDRDLDVRLADGTDIESGLTLALSLLPADAAGRIVLISDGVETAGDALRAAGRASARAQVGPGRRGAVPIDVVPLDYDVRREVVVESLDAPPHAAAGAAINLRAVLNATDQAGGTLRLFAEDRPIDLTPDEPGDGLPVQLDPGRNVFILPVQLDARRLHRFNLVFEPHQGHDTIAENNSAQAYTLTPGRGSVLVVDGVSSGDPAAAGAILPRTLAESGLDVTTVAPDAIPADLLGLQAYDLIILQNVPADALTPSVQEQLVVYVRDLGGGLVMIGGRDSFGAGGWRGTPVEPILPVTLDLPERLVAPELAIVFVIDRSGSMGRFVMGSDRTQQQIANQATAAAIRSLDPTDLVGVIAFHRDPQVVVPLAPNDQPDRAVQKVMAITPGGGTNIGPALEEAGRQLRGVQARHRHAIVLTDGRSMNADALPDIASSLAAEGITVSSITVGDDADVRGMQRVAERGGGTFHNVLNPAILPRVFLRAVRLVRSPMIREGAFIPVTLPSASPLTAGLGELPPLHGLTITQFRHHPAVLDALATPEGEPVLAHWTVGLGQVAAFTSDAHDWARDWLDWPGYSRFWTQAARILARAPAGRTFRSSVQAQGDRLQLRVEAADDEGRPLDFLTIPATVYPASGEPIHATLEQTGPGLYEADLPIPGAGTYVALIKPRQGDRALTPIVAGAVAPPGVEYRSLRSNPDLLHRLAAATAGRVLDPAQPLAANLFDRSGIEPTRASSPLWRALMIAALVLFLLDVGTRRVAWDRWISPEFGADLGASLRQLASDPGARVERTVQTLSARVGQTRQPSIAALDQAEARRVAQAAADARRARRLAQLHADRPPIPPHTPSHATDGDASTLLAAKRRAAARFQEPPNTSPGEPQPPASTPPPA